MSKIISAGNPILKNVAAPVEVFDKKLKFLVIDMKKTLYEANGVGLAAPQIAVSKRVFVADDGESGFRDADGQRIKPLCVNGLQHRRGGLERNFVFARMAAEEHGERFLFGVHGLFIPFVWACPPAEGRRSRIRSRTKAAAPLF